MKKIIFDFESKNSILKELLQEALNRNFKDFLISQDTYKEFEKFETLNLYSKNPQLPTKYLVYEDKKILEENFTNENFANKYFGYFAELKSKEDENDIIKLSKSRYVDFIIVSAHDWKIIPFENLIANMHKNDTDLIAVVETVKEAEVMLKTLEIGVDGILIKPKNVNDIIKLKNLLHTQLSLKLDKATVKKIQNISESERVCVDTTSLLKLGEGFLVGSTAAGFCLIHAETFETEYIAPRPFRVNAGDVSAYILVPDEDTQKIYRTKYLSELKGGDKVLAVNAEGEVRSLSIGRIKIETRPMLRFELEALEGDRKIQISCICQNAETVRLVTADRIAKPVVNIKIGDELLVHFGPVALHSGTLIKESIIEK
jgi:3-dehydroquinate synthase II